MKVRWTTRARNSRAAIWDYVAADDPGAAARLDDLFSQAAMRLAEFPHLGHPGRIAGTRELHPHRNYRLVYETIDDTIWILIVIHAARQWPPADN